MGPSKRHAASTPFGQQQNQKKQKTTPSKILDKPRATKPTTKATASSTVIPATPGADVDTISKRRQQTPTKAPQPEQRQRTPQTAEAASKERPSKQHSQKQAEQPSTLPLEPHATILRELDPKYDVHTFSVISSSKMEKRIQAVLNHLADRPIAPTTKEGQVSPPTPRPGVVLLHSRVLDSNKLISIAEIVKQRVREGYFSRRTEGADAMGPLKKQGKKGPKLSKISWYQYNRIYDVVSAPGAADTAPGAGDDEDDGFAPMMHRFTEAMSRKKASQGRANITTYMSIILSRTPIVELQKNPEISVQASTDPLEVEFEQWMTRT